MKARKVTVSIMAKTLSIDSVPALLYKIIAELEHENITGKLHADDGDTVKWSTLYKIVKF